MLFALAAVVAFVAIAVAGDEFDWFIGGLALLSALPFVVAAIVAIRRRLSGTWAVVVAVVTLAAAAAVMAVAADAAASDAQGAIVYLLVPFVNAGIAVTAAVALLIGRAFARRRVG